jgi:hypothetical protein
VDSDLQHVLDGPFCPPVQSHTASKFRFLRGSAACANDEVFKDFENKRDMSKEPLRWQSSISDFSTEVRHVSKDSKLQLSSICHSHDSKQDLILVFTLGGRYARPSFYKIPRHKRHFAAGANVARPFPCSTRVLSVRFTAKITIDLEMQLSCPGA